MDSQPVVEIGPGRGNLYRSSMNYYGTDYPFYPELMMIGKTVSFSRLFQTQPWIAAAVMRMLTWSIRVPLKVYRRTGDDSRVRLRPGEHPMADAVVTPHDRGNQAGFMMNLLGPMLVHGNSVTEVLDGAGNKIEFEPKDWRYSLPIMPWRNSLEGFTFDTDTSEFRRDVSIDQVLHISYSITGVTGPLGTSPLMQLGTTLRIEDAAQRYQQGLFKNGARPPSAVTASEEFLGLERGERQAIMAQLRKDLLDLYAGPENSGRPALLPPGLDWKPIGHTAQEAELVDQRKVAREEVAAVYLIPPPMLGILDHATFSNIETQREMVYTDCLGPPLIMIEQCITSQVIQALLQEDDVYVEFDFAGVLRGDRLKEIQALRLAIQSALLTPNEGRAVLNQQRSDVAAMDQFYLPFNNLQPVGTKSLKETGAPSPAGAPREASLFLPDGHRFKEYSYS